MTKVSFYCDHGAFASYVYRSVTGPGKESTDKQVAIYDHSDLGKDHCTDLAENDVVTRNMIVANRPRFQQVVPE